MLTLHQMVVSGGVEPAVLRLKAESINRYTTTPLNLKRTTDFIYSTPLFLFVNYFRDEWVDLNHRLVCYPTF